MHPSMFNNVGSDLKKFFLSVFALLLVVMLIVFGLGALLGRAIWG